MGWTFKPRTATLQQQGLIRGNTVASLAGSGERFDMGRVVSRAFGAISRNFPLYIGLAILLVFIPGIISRTLLANLGASPGAPGTGSLLATGVSSLISGFFGYVLQAALVYATVRDLNGEVPAIRDAVAIGFRFALRLLLLSIVSILGIELGFVLLVVPGIILGVMWSISTPAMVIENLGVMASLGRSRALTKGARWPIFGLLFVAVLVLFAPLLLVPLLSGANLMAVRTDFLSIGGIAVAVLSAGATMLLATILAAIYVELRTIKEGSTMDSLAKIFA